MDAELEWTGTTPDELAGQFDELQAALQTELEAAMEESTLRVLADAQRNSPVDTGRLRASVEQSVERVGENIVRGTIGSNVEYAPIQEVENPYLRPAIEDNLSFIEARFKQAVRNAIEQVE